MPGRVSAHDGDFIPADLLDPKGEDTTEVLQIQPVAGDYIRRGEATKSNWILRSIRPPRRRGKEAFESPSRQCNLFSQLSRTGFSMRLDLHITCRTGTHEGFSSILEASFTSDIGHERLRDIT